MKSSEIHLDQLNLRGAVNGRWDTDSVQSSGVLELKGRSTDRSRSPIDSSRVVEADHRLGGRAIQDRPRCSKPPAIWMPYAGQVAVGVNQRFMGWLQWDSTNVGHGRELNSDLRHCTVILWKWLEW